jgi:hypothetical protein
MQFDQLKTARVHRAARRRGSHVAACGARAATAPSPTVQSALQLSSDTLVAFTLRAVELVIADESRTDRETIRRLWGILNNPHLIQAVGPLGPSWLSG